MIEPIMFFGLGFLVASLFGLVFVPLVHARAVRLTARRLEAATPLSMSEIQADKDQLRAEFAMSTRRLEMSVDQLKARTTGQLAELGKKTDAINRMKFELGEKTATIFALESREKTFKETLRATEEELAIKTNGLREAERALSDRHGHLAKITADYDEQSVSAAGQRIEIVALKTQVENLKDQISTMQKEIQKTEGRIVLERKDVEAAASELADERGKVENLGERISQLERQIAQQTTEAEMMGRRAAELEARIAEQARQLGERERERDEYRSQAEAVRRVEAELRGELASLDRRHETAAESLKSEKAVIENQLDRAREDRAKLQRELAAMKREAESIWAAERVENALLRERINDVAAEVARLTAALEGPGSPIDTILAEADAPRVQPSLAASTNGAGKEMIVEDAKGTLADRIRALQNRASRLSPAS